jgi:quercetin dioxygenase-like cupin family protein
MVVVIAGARVFHNPKGVLMDKRMMVRGVLFASVALLGVASAKPAATLITPDELKWEDVPKFEGVHMAAVTGNPAKGPSHFFIKFDKGFTAPEHHHTADHYVTVVSGTVLLTVDGKESRLPAGSYFSFTGKKVHSTKCDEGSDCVLEVDSRGKWDVVPEKPMAAARKKPAR